MNTSQSVPATTSPRVYFQHVTKCAGTSLRAAIMSAMQASGVASASFYQLEPVKTNAFAATLNLDSIQVRDLLLADRLSKSDCRFIAGHFRYTEALHKALLQDVVSLTLLRDPVDRFLSLYYYNRYKQAEHGKETLPLEVYLTRPRARRSAEDYVRLFRGTGGDNRDFATAEDTRLACFHLEQFNVVGCLESMPQFVTAVEAATGLALDVPNLNKSPAPTAVRHKDLPKEIFEEVCRLCAPSVEVYTHAQRVVAQRSSAVAA